MINPAQVLLGKQRLREEVPLDRTGRRAPFGLSFLIRLSKRLCSGADDDAQP